MNKRLNRPLKRWMAAALILACAMLAGPQSQAMAQAPSFEQLDPDGLVLNTEIALKQFPRAAWGDGLFLVTWRAYRGGDLNYDIVGTRVNAAGEILDPDGLDIISEVESQYDPDVAYGDGVFLVGWADYREEFPGYIYVTRVSPDGEVLDPGGIRLPSIEGHSQSQVSIAWDGETFIVVWRDILCVAYGCPNDVEYSIHAVRVSSDGEVLDAAPIELRAPDPLDQYDPRIATGGGQALVVWCDQNVSFQFCWQISGTRLGPGGEVWGDRAFPISSHPFNDTPAVAYDGRHFGVVWQDAEDGDISITGFGFARVNASGGIVGGQSQRFIPSGSRPRLAWTGGSYVITWSQDNQQDVFLTTLSPEGAPEGDILNIGDASEFEGNPHSAMGPGFLLTAWQGDDINAARVAVHSDLDGVPDGLDNCPRDASPNQADSDGDGFGDACDNCPDTPGIDYDGDGVCDAFDNCPEVADAAHLDADGDGVGDVCDCAPDDPLQPGVDLSCADVEPGPGCAGSGGGLIPSSGAWLPGLIAGLIIGRRRRRASPAA